MHHFQQYQLLLLSSAPVCDYNAASDTALLFPISLLAWRGRDTVISGSGKDIWTLKCSYPLSEMGNSAGILHCKRSPPPIDTLKPKAMQMRRLLYNSDEKLEMVSYSIGYRFVEKTIDWIRQCETFTHLYVFIVLLYVNMDVKVSKL